MGAWPAYKGAGPLIAGTASAMDGAAGGVVSVVVEPTFTMSESASFAPLIGVSDALSAPTATTAPPPTTAAISLVLRPLLEFIAHIPSVNDVTHRAAPARAAAGRPDFE